MTIPFHVPFQSGDEEGNLARALAEGQFGLRGHFSTTVLGALSAITNSRGHILLTHSCTAALELMALTMRLGPGDEIIVPSYTFSSTAAAFVRTGAQVVFADIDQDTLTLDPSSVEERLTDHTRAVVAVHYAGLPGHLRELGKVLADHPALLLEDAAQSIDVHVEDGPLGTVGVMGAFSFHYTKNIHCGFGGALLVRDPIDFERTEYIWERGTNRANLLRGETDRYTWVEVGSSLSMDEMHAAFLAAQLASLPGVTKARESVFAIYRDGVNDIKEQTGLVTLLEPGDSVEKWNFHAAVLVLKSADLADEVRVSLLRNRIHSYIGYVPLHSSPVGERLGNKPDDLPITESVAPRVLRLPIHTEMTSADAHKVVEIVDTTIREWKERS